MPYTKEQEDELFLGYESCSDHDQREHFIDQFHAKYGHSKRSIIAKLSKAQKYIARPKVSKVTGGTPETKRQVVANIAERLHFEPQELEGLDKAPKLVLLRIRKAIS